MVSSIIRLLRPPNTVYSSRHANKNNTRLCNMFGVLCVFMFVHVYSVRTLPLGWCRPRQTLKKKPRRENSCEPACMPPKLEHANPSLLLGCSVPPSRGGEGREGGTAQPFCCESLSRSSSRMPSDGTANRTIAATVCCCRVASRAQRERGTQKGQETNTARCVSTRLRSERIFRRGRLVSPRR